ncbi:EVE domain-containing protein [Aquidulcibacter sp.]|uniref:EVE domain-containing protein n=1 Tax=Aquidulcibacter sp. TaxID=2052990 RepID=UPI0025BD71FA|nr:EVE domain-containing protein [Aquidulcibacter sp.]MCA3697350.1 EVE domain-containing protein [Aquidulcibacter sp.]
MAYWLLKSEPDSFSWADQMARGAQGEPWTGVRNHQAKNFLKQMAIGDLAFFYHTGDEKQIVGVVEVIQTAYPDPTDPAWFAVDVMAREALNKPLSLATIKADPNLAELALVKSPRLSVQPVSDAHWHYLLSRG